MTSTVPDENIITKRVGGLLGGWFARWGTSGINATGRINGDRNVTTDSPLGSFGREFRKPVFAGNKLIPVVPDKNVETVLISEIAISVGERKGHPDGVRIET